MYYAKAFTLMPPNLPLTSMNICNVIAKSPSPPKQHFAVPYVLKLLGETEEGIRSLATFDAVSYAGAAVPVSVAPFNVSFYLSKGGLTRVTRMT